VPLNKEGVVLGALALYRKQKTTFSDEEFRRTEILASQTSLALMRVARTDDSDDLLVDPVTAVANGFHLYLMFDQVAIDADRYRYPLAFIAVRVEDLQSLRRKYGHLSVDETLRTVAKYLSTQMRDSDMLIRYSHDEFLILAPKLTREHADALMSRLQNDLDHYRFRVRSDVEIPIPVSMGFALYPEDGSKLETLIETAEWRLREDLRLRLAVKGTVRSLN
jgi:diguanylate cyclase (GGDEF)-like protein